MASGLLDYGDVGNAVWTNYGDYMMKKFLVASAVLVGSLLISVAFAQEEQAIDVDQVIAMCEEQFSAETYADENERNRLIDECIENQVNAGKGQSEEG